jgi:UDP-glucose 4-epimerase
MMKFLVTGANGFVGSALVKRLVSEGYEVVAAVRKDGGFEFPASVTVISVGDINLKTDWMTALAGVDVVVHCAARVHVMKERCDDPLEAFREVNVLGTMRLAEQAVHSGVSRFVFISTVKVHGEDTDARSAFSELDEPAPEDAYGISKLEAERRLQTFCGSAGLGLTIVRPPLVYGPGVKGNFASLMNIALSGWPLPFGAVSNKRSMIYVGNLVDFILCVATSASAPDQVYLASDGEDLGTGELIRRVRTLDSMPSRLIPVPASWIRCGAAVLGMQGIASRLCGSLEVDISKAREQLCWSPPFSVDDALGDTVRSWRDLG